MWEILPEIEKEEYKRMILAFASLSEMFAQKSVNAEEITKLSPIINSKYQETVFQKVFNAVAEDIGNTSYDASINYRDLTGNEIKFLIGIKTFGVSSGAQKVAQFKANHDEWSTLINKIKENAVSSDGTEKTKDEINTVNNELYLELAKKIAYLRNARIKSSEANLQGFSINAKDNVQAVYHVLMPSKKGDVPVIYVGETEYVKIDTENISIIGCTSSKNPTNFDFTDGNHTYRYTSADSQLLMDFKNSEIIKEKWEVVYADDAYSLFANIADLIYGKIDNARKGMGHNGNVTVSYSWLITNDDGEVERYSGYNNFYGLGSKMTRSIREKAINKLVEDFGNVLNIEVLQSIACILKEYLLNNAPNREAKRKKENLRKDLVCLAEGTGNNTFVSRIRKLVYRPKNEMYIPIPNSREFHKNNPNFFGTNIGTFKGDTSELALSKDKREFNLVFEPSGNEIRAFITQDNGKAIESVDSQSYLGEWILRSIFQLTEFEPLTANRLNEIGINGIRLYKTNLNDDVHLQFIWIDEDDLPDDYVGY